MKDLSIYIHIPFCKKKCNYCAFFTFAGKESKIPSYFKALELEIKNNSKSAQDYVVNTIYFGGGTPSLVNSALIKSIVDLIYSNYNVSSEVEITLEANPESIDEQKLDDYHNFKINRLSIGMQAFQDDILKFMDRLYTTKEFNQKIKLIKQSKISNFNIDLIFGIPNQTFENWKASVNRAIELSPNHIACYSLELDVDSKWGRMYKVGKFNALDENLDREMYWWAVEALKKNGYEHYEISNFARSKNYSRHNLSFWKGKEYLGFGAGAHSYFDNKRFNNVYSIEKYIANSLLVKNSIENVEILDLKEQKFQFILLRLRLSEGLNLSEYKKIFGSEFEEDYKDSINNLKESKLIIIKKGFLQTTNKGKDLINKVMEEFFVE